MAATKFLPGDICLVVKKMGAVPLGQGAAQFFKILTVAPAMISLARNHSKDIAFHNADYSHALIFVGGVQWAHSTNAATLTDIFYPKDGDVIFRFNNLDNAKKVADTAKRWANDDISGKWKLGKALKAAFGSSKYGNDAKKRAAIYREHAQTEGGPPGEASPRFGKAKEKKRWMCSMFAIACWQANLEEGDTINYMGLDAPNSTPMTLGTYLANNSNWRKITVQT